MVKPVVLAVDDDPRVLRVVEREPDWRTDYSPPFERSPLEIGTRNGG